jgi:hypothetical protein
MPMRTLTCLQPIKTQSCPTVSPYNIRGRGYIMHRWQTCHNGGRHVAGTYHTRSDRASGSTLVRHGSRVSLSICIMRSILGNNNNILRNIYTLLWRWWFPGFHSVSSISGYINCRCQVYVPRPTHCIHRTTVNYTPSPTDSRFPRKKPSLDCCGRSSELEFE